jgi:hypothetical protein
MGLRAAIDLASIWRVCWDGAESPIGSRHVAWSIIISRCNPWAYIGHKLFREIVQTYDLKVNHKPVVLVDLFRNRRAAVDETPSGAAALSDGRTAALARQARPAISSATGELAVQRAAG